MPTKAELVKYVLGRMGARGAGQEPMPEDVSEVESIIDDKLMDLAQRKVIYISGADYLPDGSLDWLGRIMEQVIVKAFGGQEDGEAMRYAEAMLISQQTPEIFFQIRTAYF